jgi:glucose 1-dehydrogenase
MTALQGRVVVVTGTSRGIGAGIAARLIAAGARVFGVSRTRMDADAARALAPTAGAFAQIECDVTARDAPARVLAGALDAYGRVDGLVNNAGVLFEGACWEQGDAEIDATLAVNLTAPFCLAQAFAAHWLARGAAGVIVNVCSVESQVAWADPPHAAYAASKGGLLGLTRAQALELAPRGIRVLAVGPGVVATEMALDPATIGDVVAFLLSDAASYIVGEIVYPDGGYLLR